MLEEHRDLLPSGWDPRPKAPAIKAVSGMARRMSCLSATHKVVFRLFAITDETAGAQG